MKWTLERAIIFITEHQAWSMENGFYIALAGGVLNKGYSHNDLDLVFVQRWEMTPDRNWFAAKLAERLNADYSALLKVTGLFVQFEELHIEALIVGGV
jgi:hypothetical protein